MVYIYEAHRISGFLWSTLAANLWKPDTLYCPANRPRTDTTVCTFVRCFFSTVVKHHQSEIIWVGGFEDRKNSSAGADSPDTCRTRSSSCSNDNHETCTNSWYSDGCESNTLVSTPGWTYGSPYEDVWHYLGPWICKTLQTTACRTAKTSVALPLLAVAIISKGNKSAKQRDVWRCLEAQRPKVTVQASNYQRYWP